MTPQVRLERWIRDSQLKNMAKRVQGIGTTYSCSRKVLKQEKSRNNRERKSNNEAEEVDGGLYGLPR